MNLRSLGPCRPAKQRVGFEWATRWREAWRMQPGVLGTHGSGQEHLHGCYVESGQASLRRPAAPSAYLEIPLPLPLALSSIQGRRGGGAAEIPPSNAWHVLKSAPCEAGLAGHLLPSSPREMTKVLRCLTSVVVVVVRVSWLALASERFAGTQQRQ